MASEYIPGVCNINPQEITSRRFVGHIGVVLTLVVGSILITLDLSRYSRIILFVPIFIAAIGYLQAHHKFCVGYGAAGLQNAKDESTGAAPISDDVAIAADKTRARNLNLQALAIAIVATALLVLL